MVHFTVIYTGSDTGKETKRPARATRTRVLSYNDVCEISSDSEVEIKPDIVVKQEANGAPVPTSALDHAPSVPFSVKREPGEAKRTDEVKPKGERKCKRKRSESESSFEGAPSSDSEHSSEEARSASVPSVDEDVPMSDGNAHSDISENNDSEDDFENLTYNWRQDAINNVEVETQDMDVEEMDKYDPMPRFLRLQWRLPVFGKALRNHSKNEKVWKANHEKRCLRAIESLTPRLQVLGRNTHWET